MSTDRPAKVTTLLFAGRSMSEVEVYEVCGGEAAVFTLGCPGKKRNEDAAFLVALGPDRCVFGVADGAGGMPGADRASSLALETLCSSVQSAAEGSQPLDEAILHGFEEADRAVSSLNLGAATTLAVVELHGSRFRCYHVGDSTVLVVNSKGKRRHHTVSHSPIGYAIQAGILDEIEAMGHEARHLVSNMVGVAGMQVEVGGPVELAPKDTVIVASDGLFDNLLVDEVADLARKGDLATMAPQLAVAALERMGGQSRKRPSKPDDLSFVVYRPGR